jgi:cadmium resistance protein CadD (predicted permease)
VLEGITIVFVAAGAFVATSLDNLLLLSAFHGSYRTHTSTVTSAYVTGMLLIGVLCVAIGETGEFVPVTYLGLLGLIPLSIGVISLLRLLGKNRPGDDAVINTNINQDKVFATVLTTQLANGADTTATFSALLADSSDHYDFLIEPTFLAMVFIFAGLAKYSQNHKKFTELLSRYGHYVTPVILIVVGVFILNNTVSDLMPGS